jgi:uncharacterized membrane protein YkvA (DUF1232 family)
MLKDTTNETLEAKEMNEDEATEAKAKTIFTDEDKKMQFYENLRKKVTGFSAGKGGKKFGALTEYLFVLPDLFILVCRLAVDDRVPNRKKVIAGAILTYLVLPFDIIPDFIPVIGHVDDLVLAVLGLNMIFNDIDKQILLDNWSGKGDILELLQTVTAKADQFLDKNILDKLKKWINKKV